MTTHNTKMGKIVCILLTVTLLLGSFSAPVYAQEGTMSIYASYRIPTGSVRMTAHRGYSAVAPENTLPAFRLAGEYGFWGAECDTSPTADGVWIVMHDDTVDRTTDGEGKVGELTFDEIRALTVDAGSRVEDYPGTRVPTLTEYLDVCAAFGMHPVIEIKPSAPVESLGSLAALLLARTEKDMFTIITFGRSHAARIKTLMPETPVFLLMSGDLNEDFDGAVRFCVGNGLDGLDFCCNWDEAHIRSVRDAGLRSMAWTVDSIETADKLYAWGVRDFTTNTLTSAKPSGTVWQQLLWLLRDVWYRITVWCTNAFGR